MYLRTSQNMSKRLKTLISFAYALKVIQSHIYEWFKGSAKWYINNILKIARFQSVWFPGSVLELILIFWHLSYILSYTFNTNMQIFVSNKHERNPLCVDLPIALSINSLVGSRRDFHIITYNTLSLTLQFTSTQV